MLPTLLSDSPTEADYAVADECIAFARANPDYLIRDWESARRQFAMAAMQKRQHEEWKASKLPLPEARPISHAPRPSNPIEAPGAAKRLNNHTKDRRAA